MPLAIRKGYIPGVIGRVVARHLYERCGFRLVHEQCGSKWGSEVLEQRFEWGPEDSVEPGVEVGRDRLGDAHGGH
jgi:hypothetical protein